MKVVALVSGGKDSCYSMAQCAYYGHEIVALANLLPESSAPDELDSYMYQTVGHQLVDAYAACTGIPLFRKRITGTSTVQEMGYMPTHGDEVEDLLHLLAYVKECIPQVQAVASGAIASDYQRLRVENVCGRLNLMSLAYLWHQPQRQLLRSMVESGIEAILVKVACLGLQPHKHLGKSIAAMEPLLLSLNEQYGCNVCGEGGEYETLTLDCPMFTRGRIVLDSFKVVVSGSDAGHLEPLAFRVVPKPGWEGVALPSDVRYVPRDHVPPAPKSGHGHAEVPRRASQAAIAAAAAAAASSSLQPAAGGAASAGPTSPNAAAGSAAAAAAAHHAAAGAASAAASAAAVAADAAELGVVAPPGMSYGVHMASRSSGDYVQLACRAVRVLPALVTDITESDTTAALQALLSAVEHELAGQGLDLSACLFVHLFLANIGHFQAANGVYCKHFPQRDPPSRACVQVCLPPDCPVMCDLLLAKGSGRLPQPPQAGPLPDAAPQPLFVHPRHSRKVLHVQSISAWAPSCIGPYSQSTSYRGLLYMAGSIPLDPPSMTLVPGDITAQLLRALASCEAVAVAQRSSCIRASLGFTVYLAVPAGGGGGGGTNAGGGPAGAGGSGGGAPDGARGPSTTGMALETRVQVRTLLETLLEYGLPPSFDPQQKLLAPTVSSRGPGTPRASATNLAATATTTTSTSLHSPNSLHIAAAAGRSGGGASGLPGRGAQLLGVDEPDDAALEASVQGSASPAPLDPYLQPPEVKCSLKPSVVYVEVPALPRGSLVEIQPVCMDVETLALLRRLSGPDISKHKRSEYQRMPSSDMPATPAASSDTSSMTSPRPSMAAPPMSHHGSCALPWTISSDAVSSLPTLAMPLPSPTAAMRAAAAAQAAAAATANGAGRSSSSRDGRDSAPTSGDYRQALGTGGSSSGRSSRDGMGASVGAAAGTGASGRACGAPAAAFSAESQTHRHSIAMPPSPYAGNAPLKRMSSSGLSGGSPGAGGSTSSSGAGGTPPPHPPAAAAAAAAHAGAIHSSPAPPAPQPLQARISTGALLMGTGAGPSAWRQPKVYGRLSMDNVSVTCGSAPGPGFAAFSFDRPHVSSSAVPTTSSTQGPDSSAGPPGSRRTLSSMAHGAGNEDGDQQQRHIAARASTSGLGFDATRCSGGGGGGNVASPSAGGDRSFYRMSSSALTGAALSNSSRTLSAFLPPAGVSVQLGSSGAPVHPTVHPTVHHTAPLVRVRSPFEGATGAASHALGGGSPQVAAAAPAPPGAGGSSGNSEVMVTTVSSYGLVLRSLFHLTGALFAPGTTRAQLTRRFRRAAATVLAAHNMDLSHLISARCWYQAGKVKLEDDEFGTGLRPAAGGAGVCLAHALGDEDLPTAASSCRKAATPGGDIAAAAAHHAADGGGGGSNGNSGPLLAVREGSFHGAHNGAGSGDDTFSRRSHHAARAAELAAATEGVAGAPSSPDATSFHVTWVPVTRLSTNSCQDCVAVLELLASCT